MSKLLVYYFTMGADGNEPNATITNDLDANIQTYFAGYEEVARAEAAILFGDGGVVKLYQPKYPLHVIQRYSEVTNFLAQATTGSVIDIAFPSKHKFPFSIIVNPVLEVNTLPSGLVYTRSKIIPGQHLEESANYARRFGAMNFVQALILENSYMGVPVILESTDAYLKSLVPQDDRIAINIQGQNIKLSGDGQNNRIEVTDISSMISEMI